MSPQFMAAQESNSKPKFRKHSVSIVEGQIDRTKKAICKRLPLHLKSQILATKRFLYADKNSDYILELTCSEDDLNLLIKFNDGRNVKASISSVTVNLKDYPKTSDVPAIALLLTRAFYKEVPWDGELINTNASKSTWTPVAKEYEENMPPIFQVYPASKNGKKTPSRKVHRVQMTPGYIGNQDLTYCLPIEVGRLQTRSDKSNAEFVRVGEGIMSYVSRYDALGEIVITNVKESRAAAAYVYRLSLPSSISKLLQGFVDECKSYYIKRGQSTESSLFDLDLASLATREAVELNAIRQSVGVSSISASASNGVKAPSLTGIYVKNEILLGKLLLLHMNLIRNLDEPKWQSAPKNSATKFQSTLADVAMSLQLSNQNWHVYFGPGAFYVRVNVPYYTGTESSGYEKYETKSKLLNPGIVSGVKYSGEVWKPSLSIFGSTGKSGHHYGTNVDISFHISDTWIMGLGYSYNGLTRAKPYPNAVYKSPSVELHSIGLHLGFALKRTVNPR